MSRGANATGERIRGTNCSRPGCRTAAPARRIGSHSTAHQRMKPMSPSNPNSYPHAAKARVLTGWRSGMRLTVIRGICASHGGMLAAGIAVLK